MSDKWARCRLADFDYVPVAPFRTVIGSPLSPKTFAESETFEDLASAIDHWVRRGYPVMQDCVSVIQDYNGVLVLGYNRSDTHEKGYAWWGVEMAYRILAGHSMMRQEEVVFWEIEASGALNDMPMLL